MISGLSRSQIQVFVLQWFRLTPRSTLSLQLWTSMILNPMSTLSLCNFRWFQVYTNLKMSDGSGNWWDPLCPCKVTRKRIVMTTMAICCFVLTAWTVVITGQTKSSVPQNVSLVFIDDSKSVDNLNITLSSRVMSSNNAFTN